jgi:LDH2 family malate/lactate/ureidoglycolate dehydrogenase
MSQVACEYRTLPAKRLRAFGADCFAAAGMPEEEARLAAELLVRSELRGVETHGLVWLPNYCRALREGRVNPTPRIAMEGQGAALRVDGDGGLGHVVSARAMDLCIERAREQGAAFAAVRNSRHNGAASLYALRAMEAGLIGLSLTGGGVRVAPAGGREALLGTNPIAFAAPAGEEPPIVLDMATSVAAGARVTLHARKGLPIPEGWALTPEGEPTTEPELGDRGALLPLGGTLEMGAAKGFGLGLVVETLCNLLTGMATGPERARGEQEDRRGTGHFFAALRIDLFEPAEEFRRRMDRTLRILRESTPQAGIERVCVPGELEWQREREREAAGVPLLAGTIRSLRELAGELGVPGPE